MSSPLREGGRGEGEVVTTADVHHEDEVTDDSPEIWRNPSEHQTRFPVDTDYVVHSTPLTSVVTNEHVDKLRFYIRDATEICDLIDDSLTLGDPNDPQAEFFKASLSEVLNKIGEVEPKILALPQSSIPLQQASKVKRRCREHIFQFSRVVNSSTPVESEKTYHHLPKIQLPKFSGKFLDWPNFWQLFNSLFHSKHDL